MATPSTFDTLIFGAGPAGLATAIALRQLGHTVLVLSREQKYRGSGESLAATARLALMRLDLWETFQADEHPPCYANSAAWGQDSLRHFPFILSPNGHGWHIDRALFDQRMVEKAESLGIQIILDRKPCLTQQEDGSWLLESAGLTAPVIARMAVDATGRNSWLARHLGIERLKSDDQIALVAFLETTGATLEDRSSLVESVYDGWWYSAIQPNGSLACIFFTDPDLQVNRDLCHPATWCSLVHKSIFTRQRLEQHGYALVAAPFFTAANSSLLPSPVGHNWLAVGDAALSYDPLSSHGLSLALVSGTDAAQAIHGHLKGAPYLLEHFGMVLQQAFLRYSGERFEYYGLENRWSESAYWRRRQDKVAYLEQLEGLAWMNI